MQLIEGLKWRYASKKLDATKKVSAKDVDIIKEAVQLTASSYGLQPYKVLDITDPDLRNELKEMAWGQSQITDASHLFLFCNKIAVTPDDVDDYIRLKSEVNETPLDKIAGYGEFMKTKMSEKSPEEMIEWTAKQAYIALGSALAACAELHIDSTPMEGFDPKGFNERLKLKDQGYNACVLLAIGYRHAEDPLQKEKKVRKPISHIFETI